MLDCTAAVVHLQTGSGKGYHLALLVQPDLQCVSMLENAAIPGTRHSGRRQVSQLLLLVVFVLQSAAPGSRSVEYEQALVPVHDCTDCSRRCSLQMTGRIRFAIVRLCRIDRVGLVLLLVCL